MQDSDGRLLGVLQVLNRISGPFSSSDLGLLESIATQTRFAIENGRMAERLLLQNKALERRGEELDLLYQLEQETSSAHDLDTLLDPIIVRVAQKLRSQAGSVLLLDENTGKLYFRGVSGDKKEELKRIILEPGEGVVGWVAQEGKALLVNSPEDDGRHRKVIAEKLEFPAQALLAVPLFWNGKVIGAMEVLNPTGGSRGYDEEDLKVMTLIAGQVARAVSLAQAREHTRNVERLAAVGGMLAGVAHDLRNPMTVISGYAEFLGLSSTGESERQHYSETILCQVDEMTGMLSDLNGLCPRRQHPQPEHHRSCELCPRNRRTSRALLQTPRHSVFGRAQGGPRRTG